MGLFSKKPEKLNIDRKDCDEKKAAFRKIFNEAVPYGDSFNILNAGSSRSKVKKGFFMDTVKTTFYYYILGYRPSDNKMALVQICHDLSWHGKAFYIDVDAVEDVYYDAKLHQACLICRMANGSYKEIFTLKDSDRNALYLPNISQKKEIEAFLDFLEKLRCILENNGCHLSKWKR